MSDYSKNFESYRVFINKVVRYDEDMFNIPTDAHILDIGCGFGDRVKLFREKGYKNVSGIDISAYSVEKAGDSQITVGGITETKLKNESVDVAFVENVFHHIDAYETALDEISRILKPNGYLCFIEPRNSVCRKLIDFLTFKTPTPKILKGPWAQRYIVILEEIETGLYPLWLRSQGHFNDLLQERYDIEWKKNGLFFFFVKAKKRK